MLRRALIVGLVLALGTPALAKEVPLEGAEKENLRRELVAAYRRQKKLNLAWTYKRIPPEEAREVVEVSEALIGLFVDGDRIAILVEPMGDRITRQEAVTDGRMIVTVVTENEVDAVEVYRNDGVARVRSEDDALKKVARSLFDGEQVMPPTPPFGPYIDIGVRHEEADGLYWGAFEISVVRNPVPFHLEKERFDAATVIRSKREGPVLTMSKRETYTIDPRTGYLREAIVVDEKGDARLHLTRSEPIAEPADYADLIAEKVQLDAGKADSLSKRSGDIRDDLRRRPVAEALARSIVE